jgi:hypothetical protein
MEIKEMMWKIIDDWYSGSWLYTLFNCFIDCLNNIHEYFPLHDIILRTIQTPHTPNDPINPLFIWKLINESFMDELHGFCGK